MIAAQYFDGRSARARAVQLQIDGDRLLARGEQDWYWPMRDVQWPETTRHGQRVLLLADGGSITVADSLAFDRWRQAQGRRDSWVVRAQQSWRGVLVAVALLVGLGWAGYRWGVPALASGIVSMVPMGVDQAVGESALQGLGAKWLQPSRLPQARQQALRQRFEAAAACGGRATPPFRLHFHAGNGNLGPNAFALPGGSIVLTDALVELLAGHDDALLGVLGHELGHVHHRHGMRALVQFGLLSAATSLALGDFSSWLAAAPAMLGQLGYSRQAEREADVEAARLLRCNGVSPAVMVALFERLRASGAAAGQLPLALASHPMDEARIAYFRKAAE